MSTADDAWLEWRQTHAVPHWDAAGSFTEAVYKSAYRRALEDAADAWPEVEWKIPVVDEWLRELATGVAGNDD